MDENKRKKLLKEFKVDNLNKITGEMIFDKYSDLSKDKEMSQALWESSANNLEPIKTSVDFLKKAFDTMENNNTKENEALYVSCYGLLNQLSIELSKDNLSDERRNELFQWWFDVIKKIEDNNLLNKKYRIKMIRNILGGLAVIGAFTTAAAYKLGVFNKFLGKDNDEFGIDDDTGLDKNAF